MQNALERIEEKYFISDDPAKLEKADKIIFPGVGRANPAMQSLKEKNLDSWIQNYKKPFLGICLGMQLLCKFSEEDNIKCLGIIPTNVEKFNYKKCKRIPHMGWNSVAVGARRAVPLRRNDYFYFIHSYFVPQNKFTIATCAYEQQTFSAVVQINNFTGMQFHPEKSGKEGEKVLKQFCSTTDGSMSLT